MIGSNNSAEYRREFLKKVTLVMLGLPFIIKSTMAKCISDRFSTPISNHQIAFCAGNLFRGNSKGVLPLKSYAEQLEEFDFIHFGPQELKMDFEILSLLLKESNKNIIQSNYRFKNLALEKHRKAYQIIHFQNQKIGVFGLGNDPSIFLPKKSAEKIDFLGILDVAKRLEMELKIGQNCDQIFCLSSLFKKGAQNEIVAVLYRELNFTTVIETKTKFSISKSLQLNKFKA